MDGGGGDFACVVELVVGWWGGEDTVFTLKSSPVVLVGGLVEGGGDVEGLVPDSEETVP